MKYLIGLVLSVFVASIVGEYSIIPKASSVLISKTIVFSDEEVEKLKQSLLSTVWDTDQSIEDVKFELDCVVNIKHNIKSDIQGIYVFIHFLNESKELKYFKILETSISDMGFQINFNKAFEFTCEKGFVPQYVDIVLIPIMKKDWVTFNRIELYENQNKIKDVPLNPIEEKPSIILPEPDPEQVFLGANEPV